MRERMLEDAQNMEDGMIRLGDAFREQVEKSTRDRILWAVCKAFYDIIVWILKHDRGE